MLIFRGVPSLKPKTSSFWPLKKGRNFSYPKRKWRNFIIIWKGKQFSWTFLFWGSHVALLSFETNAEVWRMFTFKSRGAEHEFVVCFLGAQFPKTLEKTVGHESTIFSFGDPLGKNLAFIDLLWSSILVAFFLVYFWCWQFEFGKDFSDNFSMASLSEHCPKRVNTL